MATRSGDVDPSLVAYLMKKLNISDPDEMLTILKYAVRLTGASWFCRYAGARGTLSMRTHRLS